MSAASSANHNTDFGDDLDVEKLLQGFESSEDLDSGQQILLDYNRALALAKYKENYDEAISILQKRLSTLANQWGSVDDKLIVKIYHLLAIILIERKRDPAKALELLQVISEKSESPPPRLQQLKALCYLLLGSPKSAKRELKSVSGELLLRSYLELKRCNYKKVQKTFSSCSKGNHYYINDEAVINFCMGKRNTAVHLLSKNLSSSTPESLYNYGLMNLFTGNIKNAFEVFIRLIQFFKHNPRLWLRLAECKLEELRKERIDNFDFCKRKHDMPWRYVGEGSNRKLVVRANTDKPDPNKSDLLIIRECLLNSFMLLKSDGKADFYPNNHPSESELKKLTLSVLLNLSYVNLCLCEYYSAYQYACEGLNLSPEENQKVLLNLYAGEASVWLENLPEAITHFSFHSFLQDGAHNKLSSNDSSSGSNSIANNGGSTCDDNSNSTLGKVILCYNLAISHALNGDFIKASETARLTGNLQTSSMTSPLVLPIKVITLAIYIQLAQGNIEGAISIIKQHLPHYR